MVARIMEIGGHKINNWYVVGGVAGVAVVFYIYKKGSASSASTAGTTASSAVDPTTGLPYSQDNQVDPVTGMTYLSEAQQYGSVSAAEAAYTSGANSYSPYGSSGYGSGYGGTAGYPTGYYGSSTPATGNSYATNAAWAQAVTSGLTALGYSSTDVAAALGLYFQSMPLGAAPDGVSYASIVQAAVAEYGPPPVGTFSIVPSGNGTGGGGGGSTQVQIPDVIGQTAGTAHNTLVAAGLTPTDSNANRPGEPQDKVTGTSPQAGSMVSKGSRVSIISAAYATVPNCAGVTAGEAHNKIVSAGLVPTDPNATKAGEPQKTCRGTSPAAGASVPQGSRVTILT